MQHQICPRCKFRLTSAKAICNTCGFALQSVRKVETSAPAPRTAQPLNSSAAKSNNSTAQSLRKTQSTAQNGGGASFWRSFFGLDPIPSDKPDREEALGET